jgi:uncharacterized protein (TIGR04255 family)
VNRAELTYVNIIEPGPLWSELSQMESLVNFGPKQSLKYEQLAFSLTTLIVIDEVFLGRIHVSVQPAFDFVKAEPRVNSTLLARSITFSEPGVDRAMEFLDSAHEKANQLFKDLVTPDALAGWGIS